MTPQNSPINTVKTDAASIDHSVQNVTTDYPSIERKVIQGIERGNLRVVLSDVDSTLVLGSGHDASEIEEGNRILVRLINQLNGEGSIVIPITGSHFDSGTKTTSSILNRIQQGILPAAGQTSNDLFSVDAYVTDGGARSFSRASASGGVEDPAYGAQVARQDLDYDRMLALAIERAQELSRVLNETIDWKIVEHYDVHAGSTAMFPQEGTENGTHRRSNKIAFHFYASSLELRDQVEEQFAQLMRQFDLRVVCCEETDANKSARKNFADQAYQEGFPLKYCLDIVPYNKASPVDYYARHIDEVIVEQVLALGRARPNVEVWACGDSGNDFPLMSSPAVTHAVIVGGASAELIRLGERLTELGKIVYIESDQSKLGPASIEHAIFNDQPGH